MKIPINLPAENLATLSTESRNPTSEHIDTLSTIDMLRVINAEDARVPAAIAPEILHIAAAVDAIAARFDRGGRLFYIGAGTSGRLGVLDASECPPTFAVPQSLFHALVAGGDSALRTSAEAAEDSAEQGAADLIAAGFGKPASVREATPPSEPWTLGPEPSSFDTLIGIAASGRTPYVLGAIAHARSIGALTIGLSCVPASPLAQAAEIAITPNTGPEVLTGSTRMKAGTATKLVLNMLSTGVMIRTGAVFSNLMVNVLPTNAKLLDRAQRIIMAAANSDQPSSQHLDQSAAAALLAEAGSVKTAIVMHRLHLTRAMAEARLTASHGRLSAALQPPA